jgi:hypothetical protein
MAHAMTSFETPPPSGAKSTAAITSHDAFGSKVPLAEPSWYQHLNTPFYNASHVAWRNKLRDFFEAEVEPSACITFRVLRRFSLALPPRVMSWTSRSGVVARARARSPLPKPPLGIR